MPRPDPIDLLFVYGTLMPDHLRWPMIEPSAVAWDRASVPGELWDTGRGWPAARFSVGEPAAVGAVAGWWVRIDPAGAGALLADLDAMEGISVPPDPERDPYVRIEVPIPGVGTAWGYHATGVAPGWERIDRWEDQAEA